MPGRLLKSTAPPPPRMAYRVTETMHLLGIGRSSVYKLVSEGKLKGVKVNGLSLITADSIRAMLQGDAA